MYLNLDKLTLEKKKNVPLFHMEEEVDTNLPILDFYTLLDEKVEVLVKEATDKFQVDKGCRFHLKISDKNNAILDPENFETMVNLILVSFFRHITTEERRDREWRLDVPDNLKQTVHCSRSILKNAVNYKTTIDNFQLVIRCGSLYFVLVGDDKSND